ncbi:MAG: hypothetical protein ACTSRS_18235 [Candidatus Helarchaeota archaeon]
MDNLSERLKKKKPEKEVTDPTKKDKIMGMHAEGDEILSSRCELCGKRLPSKDLQEYEGAYYCAKCILKVKSAEQ